MLKKSITESETDMTYRPGISLITLPRVRTRDHYLHTIRFMIVSRVSSCTSLPIHDRGFKITGA